MDKKLSQLLQLYNQAAAQQGALIGQLADKKDRDTVIRFNRLRNEVASVVQDPNFDSLVPPAWYLQWAHVALGSAYAALVICAIRLTIGYEAALVTAVIVVFAAAVTVPMLAGATPLVAATHQAVGDRLHLVCTYLRDYLDINYPGSLQWRTPDEDKAQADLRRLATQNSELEQALARRNTEFQAELARQRAEFHHELAKRESEPTPERRLERMCTRFHIVARQLQRRYGGRPSLKLEDESDVQDLLHALLKLDFDDVRPEEWVPSYAGGSARVDFLLPAESTVVEVKKPRPGMVDKEIGEQLIVDIARYQSHPRCKVLICFVYDPDECLRNPQGLERDLAQQTRKLRVRVIVVPKR